jgi:hypothetical protein
MRKEKIWWLGFGKAAVLDMKRILKGLQTREIVWNVVRWWTGLGGPSGGSWKTLSRSSINYLTSRITYEKMAQLVFVRCILLFRFLFLPSITF